MRLITTIALALLGLTTWAQTSLPDLPAGAQRYSQTLWIVSSDSTLWTGATGNYAQVATREQLRTLAGQGYTKSQVDSAITSQIGLIDFPVTSVAGMTGDVDLDASDVGLGNVDNTTDLDKPISTATQGALDGKENSFSKGSLVAGTGVTLDGTLADRLVGSGNVTINASNSLTASNGLQINSGVISPVYGTTAGTVAQGNDARINNGQTAFGWGNFRDFGLGATSVPLNNLSEANDASRGSYFMVATTVANTPFSQFGTGLHVRYGSTRAFQMWFNMGGASPQYRYSNSSGVWGDINKFWTTADFDVAPAVFTRTENGYVPSPGGSGATRFLREDGSWVVPSGSGGGGTATDLSIGSRNATTLQIGSSTGTGATIPAATTTLSGLLTATDKARINNAVTDEVDPTVPSHVKLITSGNISNWNTAYSWGDYRQFGLGSNAVLLNSLSEANDNTMSTKFLLATTGANTPFSSFGTGINVSYGSVRSFQLWFEMGGNGGLQFRTSDSGGNWAPVQTVWHSGNFSPSDYVTSTNFTWSNLSGKPSTFAPSPHSHNASDINAGTLAIARIPTGTTGSTVALGNHTHTFAQITSKPTTIAGYGITDAVPTSRTITAGAGLTGGGNLTQDRTLSVVFGTGSGTVAQGNDSRINNGQTAYSWGNFRDFGLGSTAVTLNSLAEANDTSRGSYFMVATTGANTPFSQFGTGLHMRYGTNRAFQVWYNMGGGAPQYRSSDSGGNWDNIETFWTTSNLTNPASFGNTNSTVRNNQQLDARYVQLTGNQSISGTKTFNSPTVAPQYQGTSTTASSSIPTNAQSLFKATINSNTNYTLTNLTGNPRQIQVMVTNTSGATVYVNFTGGVIRMADGASDSVPSSATVIFTFLIENGSAWGVKSTFL